MLKIVHFKIVEDKDIKISKYYFIFKIFTYIRNNINMSSYGRKQPKHTRAIYLNTDDSYYTNDDRTQFSFRFAPINLEDESILYVRNTTTDYRTSGLSVKDVRASVFLGTGTTYATNYNAPPTITFTPQDGKGTGATAIAVLQASGLSGLATSTSTSVPMATAGSGYAGATTLYPTPAIIPPASGGQGATLTITAISTTGSITAGTLVAGSGYTEVPVTPILPPPPPTTLATFDPVPHTASTGVITGVPAVLNPTLNGFYNTTTFVASFQNNPVVATGFGSTDANGTILSITIDNSADNGFYDASNPISILAINGVLIGSTGGAGLAITPTYTGGRCASIIVTNGGSGYGANLTEVNFTFSLPATPTAGTITNKTIALGRLTALTFGTGGSKYKNPSIFIDPASISPPVQAVYAPLYKIGSQIQGVRMTNYGRGYTLPPRVLIGTGTRITGTSGVLPLEAEMTPTYLVEPNYYFTIKAEGFQFNRTLYTNTDSKGTPTLAVCSTSENVNNEDYVELVLPAQVINDITLTIKDRDGSGIDVNKNMTLLLSIEEIDDKHTSFKESRRQEYPQSPYSIS